jgi:hypothetical protein
MKRINSFDIDGVIYFGQEDLGVFPGPEDILITGRSFEESPKTLEMLRSRGIHNQVFFNPLHEKDKTRESSGQWKAKVLKGLLDNGYDIRIHFEDDPIQVEQITKLEPRVRVVHLVHELTEK